MICRNCGTEIADKAIVCYRCGTGTKEPLRKPAEIRRKRAPVWVVLIVLVIVVLLALFLARNYHLIGLEVFVADARHWALGVLIDFPPGHA
jgi:uncharacterized integral membrane protein